MDDAVYQLSDGNGAWVLVGTHVDDLFVLANIAGRKLRQLIFKTMSKDVEVTNDGEISWALKARM